MARFLYKRDDVDILTHYAQRFPVNTTTILLGATFALLLAAVALSFQNMNRGVNNASAEELAKIQSQIQQLRIEQERFELEKQIIQVRSNPVPDVSSPSEIQRMKDELAAKEAALAALAAEKEEAEKKAETFRDEAGLLGQREIEKKDDEHRRARLIKHAILIGTISEYVSNPEIGNYVTINIAMPNLIEVGKVLAIRRNTGILGTIKVTDINSEGAIGSPMPGFGTVPPEPGDELITPPDY